MCGCNRVRVGVRGVGVRVQRGGGGVVEGDQR